MLEELVENQITGATKYGMYGHMLDELIRINLVGRLVKFKVLFIAKFL